VVDSEVMVELRTHDPEAAGPALTVATWDPHSREVFCGVLSARLRSLEPLAAAAPGAPRASPEAPLGLQSLDDFLISGNATASLEDFLLSANPAAGPHDRREVSELLRRKSLHDWYAAPEPGSSKRSWRNSGRLSVGDWYLDGKPMPSTETPETRAYLLTGDSTDFEEASREPPSPESQRC